MAIADIYHILRVATDITDIGNGSLVMHHGRREFLVKAIPFEGTYWSAISEASGYGFEYDKLNNRYEWTVRLLNDLGTFEDFLLGYQNPLYSALGFEEYFALYDGVSEQGMDFSDFEEGWAAGVTSFQTELNEGEV